MPSGGGPDHVSIDYSHGRIIIKRSIWVTGSDGIEFPHAVQILRIRRDTYDLTGTAIAKEVVHGITSLAPARGTPAVLAGLTQGQWGIESVRKSQTTLPIPWRSPSRCAYARAQHRAGMRADIVPVKALPETRTRCSRASLPPS